MGLIAALTSTPLLASSSIRGPLWAQPDEEEDVLPLWKAALIALVLEVVVVLMVIGIDRSFLSRIEEPAPIPVMSVRLEPPPPDARPEPPRPQVKVQPQPAPPKRVKKRKPAIALEPPPALANETPSKIQIPKPEPEPVPVRPLPEKKPEPVPEPPPLPSVFRDVKPVKKVKPVYPREAEQQHIQGKVKVRLDVDLDGNVTDVQVLSAEPPGVFEESVLTAVRQYKFKKDGTTYQADQEIVFKIDD